MLCVHCPCNEIWIQQRRGFRLAGHQHRGHRGEVAVFLFCFYFLFLAQVQCFGRKEAVLQLLVGGERGQKITDRCKYFSQFDV